MVFIWLLCSGSLDMPIQVARDGARLGMKLAEVLGSGRERLRYLVTSP